MCQCKQLAKIYIDILNLREELGLDGLNVILLEKRMDYSSNCILCIGDRHIKYREKISFFLLSCTLCLNLKTLYSYLKFQRPKLKLYTDKF